MTKESLASTLRYISSFITGLLPFSAQSPQGISQCFGRRNRSICGQNQNIGLRVNWDVSCGCERWLNTFKGSCWLSTPHIPGKQHFWQALLIKVSIYGKEACLKEVCFSYLTKAWCFPPLDLSAFRKSIKSFLSSQILFSPLALVRKGLWVKNGHQEARMRKAAIKKIHTLVPHSIGNVGIFGSCRHPP